MIVQTIDRLIAEERLEAARAAIAEALEAADRTTRWRLELRRAEVGGLDEEGEALDEALLTLDDLLREDRQGRYEPEVPRAHAERVRNFALKRCGDLAAAATVEAGELAERHPRLLVARGDAALFLDDRQAASELYLRALAAAPDDAEPRLALANLRYVLGDFPACLAELDRLRGAHVGGRAERLRAACHSAVGDVEREAETWRGLIDALPASDRLVQHRMALALALATGGRRAEAIDEFRAVWQAEPDTDEGRFARRQLERLEAAPTDARRRRLHAFPTTAQKWNTCGPAVLELCLRHLGVELTQDEIARVVMRGDAGTPMFELVLYLDELGIEARRIEATPERLRAAIDLGLPVIVQEEYSTTSHVAVIVGYDEALGLFVSQDPATRRPQLKSFEWTRAAGDLFGNGGIIVLGRRGPDLDEVRARADAADLVEARHLAILDACDRRMPEARGEGREDVALAEVVRLCDEAIATSPGFKLAYYRRFRALVAQGGDEGRVLQELHRIRTRFAAEDWPHRLHGQWLLGVTGRPDEAFVEYAEACRMDPDDAHSRADMGECKWLVGDLERAERELLAALASEHHHVRAAENLAAVYLRQVEAIDAEARDGAATDDEEFDDEEDHSWDLDAEEGDEEDEAEEDEEDEEDEHEQGLGNESEQGNASDEDDASATSSVPPEHVHRWIRRSRSDLLRRATHFSRVACASHPENPFNHAVAAELHVRRTDWEAAAAAYARARELDPGRPSALWGLARVLEKLGRFDEVQALHDEALEALPEVAATYERASRFLARRGRLEDAARVLTRGAEALDVERSALVPELLRVLDALAPGRGAATRLRELAQRWPGDADFLRRVAGALEERRAEEDAVALLRSAVEAAPHDAGSLDQLGRLLIKRPDTRDEGRALLERVVELAPFAPGPRCELGWLALADGDPAACLRLLEPVSGDEVQDSRVHETRAAALEVQGEDDEGAAALRLALEAEGAPEIGLLRLCSWHLRARRCERVYALVGRVPALDLEGPLVDWVEEEWDEELRDLEGCLGLLEDRPAERAAAWRAWAGSLLGELWTVVDGPSAAVAEHDPAVVEHEALQGLGPTFRRALADALGKRADALVRLGRADAALRDLERAAGLYRGLLDASRDGDRRRSDLASVLLERAQVLRGRGDDAGAARAVEEACRVCEDAASDEHHAADELPLTRARALLERARARARRAPEEAEEDARTAHALLVAAAAEEPDHLPDMARAALTLAGLLGDRLALDASLEVLERTSAQLAAATADGVEGLAELSTEVGLRHTWVLCDAGRAAQARDACLQLIASLEAGEAPDPFALASVHHNLAVISLDLLSDVASAVEANTKAIELNDGDPGTYSNRGYAFLRGHHPERALTDGDRVIALLRARYEDPRKQPAGAQVHEALALRNIACAYEQLGELEAAMDACARSMELLQADVHRRQTAGHMAEMQAVHGRLLLAAGDVEGALAATEEAVAVLGAEVEGGHGQGEMDLVKALVAHGAARHAAGDRAGAARALERAEEATARWIEVGGAFEDVLADVRVRRATILLEQGHAAAAAELVDEGLARVEAAIAAGFDYMLPELVRLAAVWIDARPGAAAATLPRVARAIASAPAEDGVARTVLRARRRDELLAALDRHGLRDRLEPAWIEAVASVQ